jgi:hypothetical protein
MATFSKVNDFVENLAGPIDSTSGADTWKFELCSTAPTSGTNVVTDGNGVIANVAPITYTNYADDLSAARTFTNATLTRDQSGGTFTLDYNADIVITATGGAMNTWQYIPMFDDTVSSPIIDPVLGFWDHGSAIVLAQNETATIAFNASGIYTLV